MIQRNRDSPHNLETQTRSELPTTYPFIPISTMLTEDVYIPTDPLLETLTIPTFSQLQPQPQTIDSTSNETTLDSLNQEHVATETYGSKSHSVPTMETSSQNQSQESTTSTPTLMTEPLLPQLVTPATPPTTLQDQTQLAIYQPANAHQNTTIGLPVKKLIGEKNSKEIIKSLIIWGRGSRSSDFRSSKIISNNQSPLQDMSPIIIKLLPTINLL